MTRIVIDFEPDPDFSFCDEDREYVALQTLLYDDNGELVGGLSNSTFFTDEDDWITGSFNTPNDIPERCSYLREVATDLVTEYVRSLPPPSPTNRYTITIAVDVFDGTQLIAAAKALDPELADEIETVEDALEAAFASGLPPLDSGFEVIMRAASPDGGDTILDKSRWTGPDSETA